MLEDPITLSAFLAGVGVLVLFVALILRSVMPGKAQLPGWFAGGVVGIVIGAAAAISIGHLLGYAKPVPGAGVAPLVVSTGMGGGGPPGGGMGAMGGGMMGMGFGGGAGGTRRLTTLVGKLNLLCDGVKIDLSREQRVSLAGLLTDLHVPAELAAADADACLNAIEAVLTEEQWAAIDSIELPRPRPAGGGPPGGMGMAMMGGGPGGMTPSNKNPFQEAVHAERLDSLRSRLALTDGGLATAAQVDLIEASYELPVREDLAGQAVAGE